MEKKIFLNEKGFTLVEVLMALTILLIVLGIAFNFLKTSFDLDRNISQSVDLQQNARFAMQSIVRDLKNGTNIQLVNSQRIKFTDGLGTQTVEYRLSGDQLIRDENNSNSPVASSISQLNFAKGGDLITINLTASQNNQQVSLRSKVFLRRDLVE